MKRVGKLYHVTFIQKAVVAMVVADKVDFRAKRIYQGRRGTS